MDDLTRESQAVHSVCGVTDLSQDRGRLRVTGTDRVAFLHGQCTNDIQKLRPGQNCYAAFLTAKGKMRGDAEIACLTDAFLLETGGQFCPDLAATLGKYIIADDVTIEDVSAALGELSLQGRRAEEIAAGLRGSDLIVCSHRRTVEPGCDLFFPADQARRWWEACQEAGAVPVSGDTLEVLRVEAGLPKFGVDMDRDTIPVEAGLERRAISYEKGCYVGQETIARIRTYGHVNRRLAQMAMGGAVRPAPGEKIIEGDREVGWVTSAVHSIQLGKVLALGYVRRECARQGFQLTIAGQPTEVLKLCGE